MRRRITLDSNVIISALNFGGLPLHVFQLAGGGEIDVVISEVIIAEVTRVLREKFTWPSNKLRAAEGVMRRLCTVVTPTLLVNAVPDDPDDNRIIECAMAGASEMIVTGDKDLLRMQTYGEITIISVAEFLALIRFKAS